MKQPGNTQGFTLVEALIGSAVIVITGTIILYLLNIGTVLFAKNTALNVAHEQARTAIMQMMQDIHSAVSLPYLVDTNLNQVSGSGPAAGISFQILSGGPFKVASNASASQTQVAVVTGTFTPQVNQRLILPAIPIEQDITAVSISGSTATLTLSSTLGQNVTVSASGTNYNVVAYITDRVSYVVQNGILNYNGRNRTGKYVNMAQNITTATPFSIPNTPAGALYYRFVAAINLSTADPTATARGWKSANMFLNAQVPYRARLTTYQ